MTVGDRLEDLLAEALRDCEPAPERVAELRRRVAEAPRPSRRRRRPAVVVAGVAAAAAVALVLAVVVDGDGEPERVDVGPASTTTPPAPPSFDVVTVEGAAVVALDPDTGERTRVLVENAVRPEEGAHDLSVQGATPWYTEILPDGAPCPVLRRGVEEVGEALAVAVAVDGTLAYSTRGGQTCGGTVVVRRPDGTETARPLVAPPGSPTVSAEALSWSPDGQRLAVTVERGFMNRSVVLVDASDDGPIDVSRPLPAGIVLAAFRADGRLVAVEQVGEGSRLIDIHPATGEPGPSSVPLPGPVSDLAPAPTGTAVAVAVPLQGLFLAEGPALRLLARPATHRPVAWAPR